MSGALIFCPSLDSDPEVRAKSESVRAVTDASGRFTLPGDPIKPQWVSVYVTAVSEGLALASDVASDRHRELRFVMEPELRLPVRVRDERGEAVSGVRLFFWSASTRHTIPGREDTSNRYLACGHVLSPLLAPLTDKEGRTVVRHLPRGGTVCVFVRDPKWAQVFQPGDDFMESRALPELPAAPELTLGVQPAAAVEGRVRTEAGRPLSSFRVEVQGQGYGRPDLATTDAEGRFRVEGLSPGSYYISAFGPPQPDVAKPRKPTGTNLQLRSGEQRVGFDLVFPAGMLVTAKVVDTATGEPIENATFEAIGRGECTPENAGRTGPDGKVSFRLHAGEWGLTAGLPNEYDEVATQAVWPANSTPHLHAVNGKSIDLGTIRMTRRLWPTIRGIVLGPDEAPVAGAVVYYAQARFGSSSLPWTAHVTADANGRFEIAHLRYYGREGIHLRANLGDLSSLTESVVDVLREPEPQILELGRRPLASLHGRVVDDAGTPIANAVVSVDTPYPDDNASPPYPRTDASGEFTVQVWPAGEFVVSASAPKHGRASLRPVRARSGTVECGTVTLPRANSFLDILVVDEAGKPVDRARVEFQAPEGVALIVPYLLRTNVEGKLRVVDVLPGEYGVKAYLSDGRRAEAQVRAGERARVVLQRRQ